MSYVALATDAFDDVIRFYHDVLGFQIEHQWDRPNARGMRLIIDQQLRLEVLDNGRKSPRLQLNPPADRIHLVVEVANVNDAYLRLRLATPPPVQTSWGAIWFQIRDPDDVPVTFLQWEQSSCVS